MSWPTTPANESDVAQIDDLLHGKEEVVYGDGGYTGAHQHTRCKNIR
jgi:IS5 family transposase